MAESGLIMLDIRNVSKRFGSLVAAERFHAAVEPGELRAIIGPTAPANHRSQHDHWVFPAHGRSIMFDGQDVTQFPAYRR